MAKIAVAVVTVELPLAAFSIEAVKRASYALMARLDVTVDVTATAIICGLRPTALTVDMAIGERDFRREVLDQDLRMMIEQRTAPYRDAILGLAFSKTGLQGG